MFLLLDRFTYIIMLMHNNNNFIIKLSVFTELLIVKYYKTSFPRKHPQAFDVFRDVTEGPVRVLSMADNGDSANKFRYI